MNNEKYPYQAVFHLLGCYLLVKCSYESCLNDIKEYFANAECDFFCSPDVIVECSWQHAGRYLFRSRPENEPLRLVGVRVLQKGKINSKEWKYRQYPPLPPLAIAPFKNRFIGLHGAAISYSEEKCFLLIGERGSGKSTLSRTLVNEQKYSLMTDETVYLHCRTKLVEPFIIATGIHEETPEGLTKKQVPAKLVYNSLKNKPSLATHIILLASSTTNNKINLTHLRQEETFKLLLQNHLDVGSSEDESLFSLMKLAKEVPSTILRYSSYKQLPAAIPLIREFVLGGNT